MQPNSRIVFCIHRTFPEPLSSLPLHPFPVDVLVFTCLLVFLCLFSSVLLPPIFPHTVSRRINLRWKFDHSRPLLKLPKCLWSPYRSVSPQNAPEDQLESSPASLPISSTCPEHSGHIPHCWLHQLSCTCSSVSLLMQLLLLG